MERERQNNPAEHDLASWTSCTMAKGQLESPGCTSRETTSQQKAEFSFTSTTEETEAMETLRGEINSPLEHQSFPLSH